VEGARSGCSNGSANLKRRRFDPGAYAERRHSYLVDFDAAGD